jgi:hypothetical protein
MSCNTKQGKKKGLLTYFVADLRPGLQGFGGAFFALLCDPRSIIASVLDLGRS